MEFMECVLSLELCGFADRVTEFFSAVVEIPCGIW